MVQWITTDTKIFILKVDWAKLYPTALHMNRDSQLTKQAVDNVF